MVMVRWIATLELLAATQQACSLCYVVVFSMLRKLRTHCVRKRAQFSRNLRDPFSLDGLCRRPLSHLSLLRCAAAADTTIAANHHVISRQHRRRRTRRASR